MKTLSIKTLDKAKLPQKPITRVIVFSPGIHGRRKILKKIQSCHFGGLILVFLKHCLNCVYVKNRKNLR